jgi:hypothetical protein
MRNTDAEHWPSLDTQQRPTSPDGRCLCGVSPINPRPGGKQGPNGDAVAEMISDSLTCSARDEGPEDPGWVCECGHCQRRVGEA